MDRPEELPAWSEGDDTHAEDLSPHDEEEWGRFQAQLELAEGFWLGFVFAPSSPEAHILRRRVTSMLSEEGRSMHVLTPETPEALRGALPWLLSPERKGASCAWVQALYVDSPGRDEQPWTAAWDELLLRGNERREALRRHLQGGLVFVAPLSIKPRLREAAPDLWAIRSLVVELSGGVFEPREAFKLKIRTPWRTEESAPDPSFWKAEADRRQPGTAGRAEALFRASLGFSHEGRSEEAVATALEAVRIFRGFAKEHPNILPALAASLINLSNSLNELGRLEESLEMASDAVEIYRALAKAQPEAFLQYLAGSLTNLGNVRGELGQREEALAAASEAVEIHRALVKARPNVFLPDLAVALNNLGNRLRDLGQQEEALAVTREAIELAQALTKARPDALR